MSKRSRRPKAPKGCFWRDGVLYGRIQAGGGDLKWSLRTDNPEVAASRRKAERDRVVAAQRYGDQRRTFAEAMEGWGRFIVDQISASTLDRYVTSLAVLQPHLEGVYLDEIDPALVGAIVAARRDVPTIPTGRKHPVTASIATIKRDLTALSSVMDFCVDEGWRDDNPVIAWLKPGGRRKSRLQERRDPIQLPDPAHIRMVIDAAPA
jgi:integrase/recombinase XerD